jgi:hypothetical protein
MRQRQDTNRLFTRGRGTSELEALEFNVQSSRFKVEFGYVTFEL